MNRLLLLLLLTLTLGAGTAAAQGRLIRGRVVDETGIGFPSAGITVRGTQTGTTTDLDGNFQLSVPEGSTTLSIQALGYSSQDATISDNMVIRLQRSSTELTGAVVTAQAIRREKRELGYSATTLSSDEINAGNQTSALSSLSGKVAGANVTSSTGGPGGSTRVVLRGEKTIGGSNNALIVIDGVIVNNGNRLLGRSGLSEIDYGNRGNDVNPEDIENITVLRGPAAAALYGSAGANGAIMITTKSGRNAKKGPGKTEITYNTSYTLNDILKYPELQNRYGQGNQYRGNVADDRRENFSWGYEFDGKLRPWGQEVNGQTLVKPYVAQPNNIREFFNTGKTWENNVSLAGANDNNTYYLSLNSLNNTGVTPGTF
ncbi:MAG TPA: TonB-dependent receptor plug domain-containing protein, partial [Fibrella sp.]